MGKRKPNIKDYTFTKDINLFGDPVLMVLRNTDKKHIFSLGDQHILMMTYQGYISNDNQNVLDFLWENYKSNFNK